MSKININTDWLEQQGIDVDNLPEEDKNLLVDTVNSTLQFRVGGKIADTLSNDETTEFESIYGDDDAALDWLEEHVPNYTDTVDAGLSAIEDEIKSADDKVGLILGWGNTQPKISLDEAWLRKLGAVTDDTTTEDVETMITKVNDELSLRVGDRLQRKMTGEQLREFEEEVMHQDQDTSLAWLEKIVPGYQSIVRQEAKKLGHDIATADDKAGLIASWE